MYESRWIEDTEFIINFGDPHQLSTSRMSQGGVMRIKSHTFICPIFLLYLLVFGDTIASFQVHSPRTVTPCERYYVQKSYYSHLSSKASNDSRDAIEDWSRRHLVQWSTLMIGWGLGLGSPLPIKAELYEGASILGSTEDEAVSSAVRLPLYYILRVREASEQESRLISSGKFKDVQRANVKLAVRFMLQNYKLSDNIISAAATLADSNKRQSATETGQRAVENLFTILEYFDSRDVENLKVGTYDSMAGKEPLVLKGLEAARINIDEFLTYFDSRDIDAVRKKIEEENELNAKEFDSSLGVILNPNPSRK